MTYRTSPWLPDIVVRCCKYCRRVRRECDADKSGDSFVYCDFKRALEQAKPPTSLPAAIPPTGPAWSQE
jgi:hypothetical protein